ncbi:hypothetical protein P280DRAFT_512357 [Massarina eburnea CBS 473.64]|uniref:Uncharacterized protein n=1 Tax=Massarina eburnea CBS 473.64 TaxID=1395130 RepID=A0A6A6SHI4_9PLEO|nr:hypothetical protein P280DRAFT_512357 [Massarina eburnea CBS 473.64]
MNSNNRSNNESKLTGTGICRTTASNTLRNTTTTGGERSTRGSRNATHPTRRGGGTTTRSTARTTPYPPNPSLTTTTTTTPSTPRTPQRAPQTSRAPHSPSPTPLPQPSSSSSSSVLQPPPPANPSFAPENDQTPRTIVYGGNPYHKHSHGMKEAPRQEGGRTYWTYKWTLCRCNDPTTHNFSIKHTPSNRAAGYEKKKGGGWMSWNTLCHGIFQGAEREKSGTEPLVEMDRVWAERWVMKLLSEKDFKSLKEADVSMETEYNAGYPVRLDPGRTVFVGGKMGDRVGGRITVNETEEPLPGDNWLRFRAKPEW